MDVLEACRFRGGGTGGRLRSTVQGDGTEEICRSVQDVTSFFDPVGARITVSTNIPLVTHFLRLPTGIFVAFLPDFLTRQVKDVPAGTGDVGFDFQLAGFHESDRSASFRPTPHPVRNTWRPPPAVA